MPLSDKTSRQAMIKQIIKQEEVDTQTQLVELLAMRGKNVTQATVSRDLQDLGVYTIRSDSGKTIYTLEQVGGFFKQEQVFAQLQRVLGEWTDNVLVSGNLVILKTPPGSAHVVAAALDRSDQPGIIATLAGDDTVLIVVEAEREAKANLNTKANLLANDILKMAGLLKTEDLLKIEDLLKTEDQAESESNEC